MYCLLKVQALRKEKTAGNTMQGWKKSRIQWLANFQTNKSLDVIYRKQGFSGK